MILGNFGLGYHLDKSIISLSTHVDFILKYNPNFSLITSFDFNNDHYIK
jgi:hypothetical protein